MSYTLNIDIPPLPGTVLCWLMTHVNLTAYYQPSTSAEVFGETGADLQAVAMARTADGWIGFDPGVAQADNQGLARLRWILPEAGNLSFDPPGCDTRLPIVSP